MTTGIKCMKFSKCQRFCMDKIEYQVRSIKFKRFVNTTNVKKIGKLLVDSFTITLNFKSRFLFSWIFSENGHAKDWINKNSSNNFRLSSLPERTHYKTSPLI